MEHYSQYLMWMKRKQFFQSSMTMTNPFNSSCEEQAFVDGHLGGFIWRPRSHSCSFCKREFSSAQALGGHMNVHRRDRARLKQSLSVVTPQQSQVFHHPCNNNKSSLDLDYASYPSQLCFLDSNPNPSFVASTSPHSPSRVSAISTTQENLSEPTTYVSPFSFSSSSSVSSSSIVQDEHLKGFPHSSLPMPRSDSEAVRLFNDSNSKTAFEKNPRKEDFETNLSMGSNLVASQNRLSGFDCDDHQIITLKRHKSTVSSMPVLHKQCSSDDRYHFQSDSQVLEDLDLELRLGLVIHPKVK